MKKHNFIVLSFLSFLLTLSIGYSLFSETISVQGTASAKGNFDVEISNVIVNSHQGSSGELIKISEDKNSLELTVPKLEYPGAYADFLVTINNKGTIPAALISIDETGIPKDPNLTITFPELDTLKNKIITQNSTENFHVRVMWNVESTTKVTDLRFNIKLNYEQKTE